VTSRKKRKTHMACVRLLATLKKESDVTPRKKAKAPRKKVK